MLITHRWRCVGTAGAGRDCTSSTPVSRVTMRPSSVVIETRGVFGACFFKCRLLTHGLVSLTLSLSLSLSVSLLGRPVVSTVFNPHSCRLTHAFRMAALRARGIPSSAHARERGDEWRESTRRQLLSLSSRASRLDYSLA